MIVYREHIDYDWDMEMNVIGAFLMESMSFSRVVSTLREECFHIEASKVFYKAVLAVYDKGYPIDYLTVKNHLYTEMKVTAICDRRGNSRSVAEWIVFFQSELTGTAHLEFWCITLLEMAARRLLTQLKNSGSVDGDIFEETAEIEKKLKDILDVRATDDWMHISAVGKQLGDYMDEIEGKEVGITTSIKELNRLNGGFRPTHLIILAARPGNGKSAFMGRIAINAAKAGKTVGIISLEMEGKDILARSISAESDVDHWRIDRNKFEQEDELRDRVQSTLNSLSKLPIYYSDTAQVRMMDIRAKAEKLKLKHGVDLILIDYLQLIEGDAGNSRNREQEVAKMSRGLKLLAMTMKIPIVVLAQLNRQSEHKADKKPQLENLRESGSIEQDADVVMFIHSDFNSGIPTKADGSSTEGEVDLLIRKWRNGVKWIDMKLGWEGSKMKFHEISEDAPPEHKQLPQPNPRAGFQDKKTPAFNTDNDSTVPF